MKLIEIISLTAIAVFAASCEKTGNQNQNQKPEVNLSETVAGTYTGYSTAEFQYSPTPMLSQNQTLTVTAEDGGKPGEGLEKGMNGSVRIVDSHVEQWPLQNPDVQKQCALKLRVWFLKA